MNSIQTILAYKYAGQWVFDDPTLGLVREAFVSGSDDIIESMAEGQDRIILLFSDIPFPTAQKELSWKREESGGNWYSDGKNEGWLCPTLLKYFPSAPNKLYIQFKR